MPTRPGDGPDLALCEMEPIHIPGAIQPHGAVVVALADSLVVSHASANLETILGRPAEAAFGRPLHEVIGEAAWRVLQGPGIFESRATDQVVRAPGPGRGNLNMRAYRSARYIGVDIEPIRSSPRQKPAIISTQSILETFRLATTCVGLCELAVAGLRAITGFDRVMAYRFHADEHGEVIAEAKGARLEPYLGLHYPAADIPLQARRLYLRQRVGTVADASFQPVPLLADPSLRDLEPVDLTHSTLRSTSPVHREYMRNMKTAASMTIALVHSSASHEQKLWGMLVCHNSRPLLAGPERRAIADMIGQVVSLLLSSLDEAENHGQRFQRQTTLNAIINRLAGSNPLPDALTAGGFDLLRLVDAAGVVIRIDGALRCLGQTPPLPAVESALARLQPLANGAVLALDNMGAQHPDLADCVADGCGALLLPLGEDSEDAIIWFRPELSQTVAWGGDPNEHIISDPATGRLSPRGSFDVWKEIVGGHSRPWAEADLAIARELRTALERAVAQRTKADLAKLRHYDYLTGLPNRRLLTEKLAETQQEPTTRVALLFLDLDGFKAVNDAMGHAAGDALLIVVGRRLVGATGPDDVIARLGGDEFVVLCAGLDQNAIDDLAERVRTAIAAPYLIAGRSCSISASIGVAVADQIGGLDLIRAADTAMYAAKQLGGNRVALFDPSLSEQLRRQVTLQNEMREALNAGNQFLLLYQPLFRMTEGARRLAGFEAFLRWQHPLHGCMLPHQFIPEAEKSGLMIPIGEWVLATVLRQGRVLQQLRPQAEMRLAMNISPSQIPQAGFCSGLAGTLEADGFPPSALSLEVTDNILTDVAATAVLAEIRKLGVRVAIDDFGIASAAPQLLRQLQADEVKLDRQFFDGQTNDTRGTVLVGAVIALAHAAGLSVAFEGIETEAEAELALASGADIVQGLFFAPPLAASAAEDFVRQCLESEAQRTSMPQHEA